MNPSKAYLIEKSYINLVIVKAKDQYEKETQLQHVHNTDAVLSTYEKIYGTKTPINVSDLFKSCENLEKQVLVLGRAGIGKSTFCQYIAYQWAKGTCWLEYELLALIPLRRLTTHRYPADKNYSLLDLVKKEVLPFELSDKEDKLLKEHFDVKKTLWILDGYDEVVQNVPSHLKYLFEQLLKTPHHILTSRPYLNTLSYNVQMEITGFTDTNIEEYVYSFFDQMKEELEDASIKSKTLLKFLKSNKSAWGVAHIPVNLELICSVWSNQNWSEAKELTITSLYTTMVEWLCRRYLAAQNYPIQLLPDHEVYQLCHKELTFLDILAFHAMKNNTIILRPPLLEKALAEENIALHSSPHILNMGVLKSFSNQGIGTQIEIKKDHYFIHLSFQEYFAARYLVNTLRGLSTKKAIEFINYHKYNQRYALVVTFMSGILSEIGEKSTMDIFWNTVLGEPLDFIGVRHIQMVISCLEAVVDKSKIHQYNELLQWIAYCLRHCIRTTNYTILNHISPSLKRAQTVVCNQVIMSIFADLLRYDETDIKFLTLFFLTKIEISYPSLELTTSIIDAINDRNNDIRFTAILLVEQMGEKILTSEVVNKLVTALEDENNGIRKTACAALGNMSEKAVTSRVTDKLISILRDTDQSFRQTVSMVLAKIGEKSAVDEVLHKLVNALGNENEYVREGACVALGIMLEKGVTDKIISKLMNLLEDRSELVRKSACEAVGKINQKAATTEIITQLVSKLEDTSADVRRKACDALRIIGKKAATSTVISAIVRKLGDDNDDVRQAAVTFLWQMSNTLSKPEIITRLLTALTDGNQYVKKSAWDALALVDHETAKSEMVKKLVSTITSNSSTAHQNIAESSALMDTVIVTSDVITKLLIAVGDSNDYMIWKAYETLYKINEEPMIHEMIGQLMRDLEDSSDVVRERACYTVCALGKKVATNEVINKLVSTIEDKTETEKVRAMACNAIGQIGKDVGTNEIIKKLINALDDVSGDVRAEACDALGKICGKTPASEVINILIHALGDENESVRWKAYDSLCKISKEAETNEVTIKLVGALGHETVDARWRACEALKSLGQKAATNEVIAELAITLGDKRGDVVCMACEVLERMGEKAVTNKVIRRFVDLIRYNRSPISTIAEQACVNIFRSSTTVRHLNPEILSAFFQLKPASSNVKYMSVEQFINILFTTENIDWITALIRCTYLNEAALTVVDDKIVVYDDKEPFELPISSSQLRRQLTESFIQERERLHLFFKMTSENIL